jgi:hypothetical protein
MLIENVELSHLAKAMGLLVPELFDIARNPGQWYGRSFAKRIGAKMREIDPSTPQGKRWLRRLGNFIASELPIHPCAHGSVRRRCNLTAARKHLGDREVFTRDAKDCFPSVEPKRFFDELVVLGFRHDVAIVMTELLLYRSRLPQGSPASNAALNLFFYRTDEVVRKAVMVFGGRYTRYCDDLVVSISRSKDAAKVAAILDCAIASLGLRVNSEKRDRNGHQGLEVERHVNGIRVDEGVTQLPSVMVADILDKARRYAISAGSCNLDALCTVARRRRTLDGLFHYARRVEDFPILELTTRLCSGDLSVVRNLGRYGVKMDARNWWRKNQHIDAAATVKAGIVGARRAFAS